MFILLDWSVRSFRKILADLKKEEKKNTETNILQYGTNKLVD